MILSKKVKAEFVSSKYLLFISYCKVITRFKQNQSFIDFKLLKMFFRFNWFSNSFLVPSPVNRPERWVTGDWEHR